MSDTRPIPTDPRAEPIDLSTWPPDALADLAADILSRETPAATIARRERDRIAAELVYEQWARATIGRMI